ncbi:unnamed protein product [Gemmata massiliana]|uniref:Uncharacterized protein n=1 Tax=Gemmata massiliana TaxID=1210884 RepID=A0A6P2D491_9BACT|nr:hypothetical protein [Gemmata massiliana]VTR95245.1 unnamed protein product [Gemmata massiliana]
MAVKDIIEDWKGRGATTDEKGVRTLKRRWTVTTDDDKTGEPEVIDSVIAKDPSAGLYAPHPKWKWAICRQLTAAPNNGPRVWTVDASYSSGSFAATGDGSGTPGTGGGGSGGGGGNGGNPTSPTPLETNSTPAHLRSPVLSVKPKQVTKVLEKDVLNDKKITNTVGDPFDPLPEVFRSHHVITWRFYRKPGQLNWPVRSLFQDTLNMAEYRVYGRVYPPHSLRCTEYSVDTVWETDTDGVGYFFAITVEVEYNPDLWDIKLLNTGRRRYISGSLNDPARPPQLATIVDGNGQPVPDPVPLSIGGNPVAPGGEYHYVNVNGYLEKDWSTLLG